VKLRRLPNGPTTMQPYTVDTFVKLGASERKARRLVELYNDNIHRRNHYLSQGFYYPGLIPSATPEWADKKAIKAIYGEAKAAGLTVDHVIPLRGTNVCGLHVETNMQLLTKRENSRKGNR
jgi:5-methylcytosine-specific restriction endonuclease McrA